MSVVIETGHTGNTYNLKSPRIGWNSTGKRGTVSESSEATGYAATNAVNPMTYSYWRPSAMPATFEIRTDSPESISYCGIAGHDLGTVGATVYFEVYQAGAWVEIANTTPADDGAIMFLCDTVSVSRARIRITGGTAPTIAVVAFGAALEMPQMVYSGYSPIDLAVSATLKTNVTNTGQFAGRTVERVGARNQISIRHLTETWVRANLKEFIEEARERPFFIAERPDGYPDAVDYCFTEASIIPERSGPKNYMTVVL